MDENSNLLTKAYNWAITSEYFEYTDYIYEFNFRATEFTASDFFWT